VFDCYTAAKACRQWRLLILDGHGSHLTPEFLEYCNANCILLMVFPPHSTHSLQPLDVALFAPLSRHYTEELTHYLQRTQGLMRITKRDFYRHVANGCGRCSKRFNNYPQQQDEDVEIGEHGDGDSWPELRKIFNAAVADKARIKRLSQSLHLLQVNNKLLCTQNKELQHELNVIKKRPTQQTILTTQDGNDWHGGAVFYSPRKLASERACKAAELNEATQLQLKKTPTRERQRRW
jgi:DNA uptake protein ComE-like DNA-binding protein